MRQKNVQQGIRQTMPINRKAKDTFFKKVYESEERQRKLAADLLGLKSERVSAANVRPVLFGNKENDLAFLCGDVFYIMMEEQSSVSPNIPYRMLEYIVAGLRSTVDSEQLLYGRSRVYFPVPKLYLLQIGLEQQENRLPQTLQYDTSLSESYIPAAIRSKDGARKPDLEVEVHVYDFRMTQCEMLEYIEQEKKPERFLPYESDMQDYALTANGITYMQRTQGNETYKKPRNISSTAEFLELMLKRGIFVDLLSDKEVCDMTMAQFSRDEILIYQGREAGREEGREEGREAGREEGIEAFIVDKLEDGIAEETIIGKLKKRFALDEKTARKYYETYAGTMHCK